MIIVKQQSLLLVFFTSALIGGLLSRTALGNYPDPGSTVPCGDGSQCGATFNDCTTGEWHFMLSKWVKCCVPVGSPPTYHDMLFEINVYNTITNPNARCYQLQSSILGDVCNPTIPCSPIVMP
jgi:hypothetical protein